MAQKIGQIILKEHQTHGKSQAKTLHSNRKKWEQPAHPSIRTAIAQTMPIFSALLMSDGVDIFKHVHYTLNIVVFQ